MNKYVIGKYTRISKAAARKAYIAGERIAMFPCKANPASPWNQPYILNRASRESFVIDEIGLVNDFNGLVNSFEYYNCQYAEMGKYAAFYRISAWNTS